MGEALRIRARQNAGIPLDAEFACEAGEILALVGPSGAGKTTLLRCIAGLTRPLEGRIECGGEVWLDTGARIDVATRLRSVGMVFQSYALFPHLSALQNVVAALGHRPASQRAQRARELLERVHLGGLESRRPADLSGGQQQRVAVARALARDPKVLLLDEPFSAVARVTRQKLYRELAEMRRDLRMPVVLVTHDLDEAAMLADRMCMLHHGATLQTAPPFELMSRPKTLLVARLVDLRNVYAAVVREHRPAEGFTLIDWAGRTLQARLDESWRPGDRVSWAIPSAHVILHRRERPSRGEHENPVEGTIAECLLLGETTSVVLEVGGGQGVSISFSVPTHAARRNGLATGIAATVSLLADAIHLMPRE